MVESAPRRGAESTAGTVAIIGGGLAGLTCAWRLKQAGNRRYDLRGLRSPRWPLPDAPRILCRRPDGGTRGRADRYRALRRAPARARTPAWKLVDLIGAEPPGTLPFFFFDGAPYPFAEAARDFQAIDPQLRADIQAAGYPTLYNSYTARGRELDRTSIAAYLDQIVPGGRRSRLGKLLDVAYNIEYGTETNEQSSLNLLYLLGYSAPDELEIFGESDERYHIRGGQRSNGERARGSPLTGQVELLGMSPARSRASPTAGSCSPCARAPPTREVIADQVVLGAPRSRLLRASVDLSRAGFSALQAHGPFCELGDGDELEAAIAIHRSAVGITLGNTGDSYADTGYQVTWEATRAQAGAVRHSWTTPAAASAWR